MKFNCESIWFTVNFIESFLFKKKGRFKKYLKVLLGILGLFLLERTWNGLSNFLKRFTVRNLLKNLFEN